MPTRTKDDKLRPIAFMVMPFRQRTVPSPPQGAPAKIDCDALWDRAFRPALEELGYLPIRADIEVGTVIVKDMLERLALAELVVADMTLPNGNVYYEVGLRHAARRTHCILIAADWSSQLFDTDQIRTERYPLSDGRVTEDEAQVIHEMLVKVIPEKKNSPTPFYELVKDKGTSTVFREQVEKINAFQTQVRVIRMIKDREAQRSQVRELCRSSSGINFDLPEVALELLTLVRDSLGWKELLDYVETFPPVLRKRPFIKEQVLLAQSQLGDHHRAIEGLRMLIELQGDSAERRGLIGGRYKRLWRQERDDRLQSGESESGLEEEGYLDAAINSYTLGMELDYNEYYCASNLPSLLNARRSEGDREISAFVDSLIVRSCERKIRRGEDDGWAKPTLLVAAFRCRDVGKVKALALEVAAQGAAAWELKSALGDINDIVSRIEDGGAKVPLAKIRDQLARLAEKA